MAKIADDQAQPDPERQPSKRGSGKAEEQPPKPQEQVTAVAGETISTRNYYEAQLEERRRKLKRLRTRRVVAIGVANSERLRKARIRIEQKPPPIEPPKPAPSGFDL